METEQVSLLIHYPEAWLTNDEHAHRLAGLKHAVARAYDNYILLPDDVMKPRFEVVTASGFTIAQSVETLPVRSDIQPLAFSILAILMSIFALLVSLGVV